MRTSVLRSAIPFARSVRSSTRSPRTLTFYAVVVGLLLVGAGATALAAPMRISVTELAKDQTQATALENGYAKMRASSTAEQSSAQFRTSLAYWANTHGYFGTGGNATDLTAYIAYRMPACVQTLGQQTCDAYYAHMGNSQVPEDGFTANVWGTCQHGNLNFLPWHRLYLHFFERSLRKQSGDNSLALPYWDYYAEKSSNGEGLAIPALVRTSASSPLYDEFRTGGLNENTSAVDPRSASAAQAFKFDDFTHFSNTLQQQPHGVMHCALGTGCATPDMGFVPIAGLDPVFYMHHSNIDRLWQCWLNRQSGGKPIDLAWAKANLGMPESWYDIRYDFADENGSKVTVTIADAFAPGMTPRYAQEDDCDISIPTATVAQAAMAEGKALQAHAPMGSAEPVTLRGTAVTVPLRTQERLLRAAPLPKAVALPGRTILVLDDVRMDGSPALTYEIHLASAREPKRTVYIATFNFFGVGGHGGAHHGEAAELGAHVYDVSAEVRQLGVDSADDLAVHFKPTTLMTTTSAAPAASAMPSAPGATADRGGVTVGLIRLETIPDPT
jgi:hypothetical protein